MRAGECRTPERVDARADGGESELAGAGSTFGGSTAGTDAVTVGLSALVAVAASAAAASGAGRLRGMFQTRAPPSAIKPPASAPKPSLACSGDSRELLAGNGPRVVASSVPSNGSA